MIYPSPQSYTCVVALVGGGTNPQPGEISLVSPDFQDLSTRKTSKQPFTFSPLVSRLRPLASPPNPSPCERGNAPKGLGVRLFQNGPLPIQLVVVIAVRKAVSASFLFGGEHINKERIHYGHIYASSSSGFSWFKRR